MSAAAREAVAAGSEAAAARAKLQEAQNVHSSALKDSHSSGANTAAQR
jgi:hypothetical protein